MGKRTKEAKKKAQEAALMAKQATEESNERIKMLSIIKQAVATLPEEIERLDVLETLEKSVAQIEKTLNSQNLKKRINVLKSKNEEVKQSLESFTISTHQISTRRDNSKRILAEIPDTCPYKNNVVESNR